MLVYERIQTLVGHEIDMHEAKAIARILNKEIKFMSNEESTEPWQVDPKPTTHPMEINNVELIEEIFEKAEEMGIEPAELVSHIIKDYIGRQRQKVAAGANT